MTMKRGIGETELDGMATASCLMLLSRGHENDASLDKAGFTSRVFECKTCNRRFPSFQALGGHRASHKKPRTAVTAAGDDGNDSSSSAGQSPKKPKTHECSICGLEFSIGQALGGHMRRHRPGMASAGLQSSSDGNSNVELNLFNADCPVAPAATQVPVVKKSNNRRVLWLDLNLTPTENDLNLQMVKPITPIFCYL